MRVKSRMRRHHLSGRKLKIESSVDRHDGRTSGKKKSAERENKKDLSVIYFTENARTDHIEKKKNTRPDDERNRGKRPGVFYMTIRNQPAEAAPPEVPFKQKIATQEKGQEPDCTDPSDRAFKSINEESVGSR